MPEVWNQIIQSSLLQKVWFLLLVLLFGFFGSLYVQREFYKTVVIEKALFAAFIALVFFMWFCMLWWSYKSAILAGLLGAIIGTHKAQQF